MVRQEIRAFQASAMAQGPSGNRCRYAGDQGDRDHRQPGRRCTHAARTAQPDPRRPAHRQGQCRRRLRHAGLPRRHCGAQRLRHHTCSQERPTMAGKHPGCSGQKRNPPRHPSPWPHHLAALERLPPTKPGRNKDAVPQATWRTCHGARLRQTSRRATYQGRNPEPLHGPRNAANSTRGMSPFKGRENSTSTQFVHVWMPPLVQVVFERFERVIGCGHVSGLSLRRLIQPRAGMAMRGSEADQQTELVGSSTNTAFSDPDLSILCPYSSVTSSHSRRAGAEWKAWYAYAIVATGLR